MHYAMLLNIDTPRRFFLIFLFLTLLALLVSCTNADEISINPNIILEENQAAVIGVSCQGQPNNYTLSVTIASPDTGCDQYADWWEVITPDSVLIYRRILAHSHVNEQPFSRSGGIVDVGADEPIYVRAHMNNLGYGSFVFSGTIRGELKPDTLDQNYAISISMTEPLPIDCDF